MSNKESGEMQAIRRNFHLTVALLIGGGVFFSFAWLWLLSQPVRPGVSLMRLSPVTVMGPTALCPGDALVYDQTLTVNAPGVYDMDVSVWRVTPPSTVIFSVSQRMVFDVPTVFPLGRSWIIPNTYTDFDTALDLSWQPGEYKRIHSIIAPGRNTSPSIETISFTIRENCGTGGLR